MIAAGCWNGKIHLLDTATFAEKRSLTVDSTVRSVAFSPDGSKIAAAYSDKIQIFDVQTQGKIGSPLSGHSDG
jgi:WD40 repeat protein